MNGNDQSRPIAWHASTRLGVMSLVKWRMRSGREEDSSVPSRRAHLASGLKGHNKSAQGNALGSRLAEHGEASFFP